MADNLPDGYTEYSFDADTGFFRDELGTFLLIPVDSDLARVEVVS